MTLSSHYNKVYRQASWATPDVNAEGHIGECRPTRFYLDGDDADEYPHEMWKNIKRADDDLISSSKYSNRQTMGVSLSKGVRIGTLAMLADPHACSRSGSGTQLISCLSIA
jgi:hypothetical protein